MFTIINDSSNSEKSPSEELTALKHTSMEYNLNGNRWKLKRRDLLFALMEAQCFCFHGFPMPRRRPRNASNKRIRSSGHSTKTCRDKIRKDDRTHRYCIRRSPLGCCNPSNCRQSSISHNTLHIRIFTPSKQVISKLTSNNTAFRYQLTISA